MALAAEAKGWSLFNATPLPPWMEVAAPVVLLDLAIYGQHVAFHAVPVLWRLHRMHHADLEFDVTTGVRFHPVEIILSMLIKFGAVTALGAPAVGVLLFEVLLNATSMFNHGNVRLPERLDRALVHKSAVRRLGQGDGGAYRAALPTLDARCPTSSMNHAVTRSLERATAPRTGPPMTGRCSSAAA